MNNIINLELLKVLVSYSPETGKLFWKKSHPYMFPEGKQTSQHRCRRWNSRWAGAEAFTSDKKGYRTGVIFGKRYAAHRIIWALHYGEWPDGQIDHINHDRADNRITNLRDVTCQENHRNQSLSTKSVSGSIGVSWSKEKKKWHSRIKVDHISKHLGYYNCITAAMIARKLAEQKYGFHENHGGI